MIVHTPEYFFSYIVANCREGLQRGKDDLILGMHSYRQDLKFGKADISSATFCWELVITGILWPEYLPLK